MYLIYDDIHRTTSSLPIRYYKTSLSAVVEFQIFRIRFGNGLFILSLMAPVSVKEEEEPNLKGFDQYYVAQIRRRNVNARTI